MQHIEHKRSKVRLIYVFLASLILGGAFSTYAQLSDQAYTVETVHIFPAQIDSQGFENAETLTFQNLEEYALLQDFNTINSATLGSLEGTFDDAVLPDAEAIGDNIDSIDTQLEEIITQPEISVATTSDVSSSTESNNFVTDEPVATSTPEVTTNEDPSSDVQTEEVVFDVLPEVFEFEAQEPELGDETESEVIIENEEAETEISDSSEVETISETESIPEEDQTNTDTSTTTVQRQVTKVFALAVQALTETFSSTSATSSDLQESQVEQETTTLAEEAVLPEEVSSSTEQEQAELAADIASSEEESTASSETGFGFTAESEQEVVEVVEETATATATDTANTQEIDIISVSSTTASTTETPQVNEAESEVIDSSAHVIQLSNFGFPLDEGVAISGAQLRMSFAAKQKETQSEIPVFTVNYSLDGGDSWSTGGSVVIDDEVSNSINGGYYLFALPTITDQAILKDLQVELRYDADPALVSDLFVESVWLELFVLEPPEDGYVTPLSELLEDDGYQDTKLSGDTLRVSADESIDFTFTDNNDGETLIVKADQKTYEGLSEATTYFSVTNTSDQTDEFTVQTYFPSDDGEVTNLEVFNLNKPRDAVVAEYRPYVYHCEAGWQSGSEVLNAASLADLSIGITGSTTERALTASSTIATSTSSEGEYSCLTTSVVRSCEVIEGEGTACVMQEKVQDHNVIKYAPGWEPVEIESGELSDGGLLRRIGSVFGIGPDRKDVPDEFVGEVYSDDTFSIAPGETRYFKMDIAFAPFTTGEWWIEVIGDREYGLLDPFWSSNWQYRMPLNVSNPVGSDQTEFQVRLELDAAMSDFWDNVQSDGGDIRFIQEVANGNLQAEVGPQFENSYDDSWEGRIALTIDADKIDSLITDFPIYVNLADLGPDFWSGVQSDGRDIRVTEADGSTELPYDLVSINTSIQTGELHFLASRIDSLTDTTFHIYFNNPAAAAYSSGDQYGRNAVWAAYEAVYHFEEDPTLGVIDMTGNGFDLVNTVGVAATTTGQLGTALDTTAASVLLEDADWTWGAGDNLYSSGLYFMDSSPDTGSLWQWSDTCTGDNCLAFMPQYSGSIQGFHRFGETGGNNYTYTPNNSIWHHFTTFGRAATGDLVQIYEDNVLLDTYVQSATGENPSQTGLQIGRYNTATYMNIDIDELRFSTVEPSLARVAAEYANFATTTDFYATSTQLVGGLSSTGWYDTSWNGRVKFSIQEGTVEGTQVDYPVYLDLGLFDSEFFSAVNPDGADIRITASDGKTELAHEVVSLDTGSETGELYFKTTISGGESFYIYFDNEDAAAYDRTDTYGSESVWTNGYQAVYHFEEEAAGAGNLELYKDSTANRYHADDDTTDTDTTGRLGSGVGFGADILDAVLPPNDIIDGISSHTISWWHNTTQTADAAIISGANAGQQNEFLYFFPNTTQLNAYFNGPAEGTGLADTVGSFNTGLWQYYQATADAGTSEFNLYVNGQGDTENPDTQVISTFSIPNGGVVIAQEQDAVNGNFDPNQRFIGQLDEFRISNVVRDPEWLETEYNNMEDATNFFATSTAEVLTVTEFTELDHWVVEFDDAADTATVWVQVEDLPAAGATIYLYYGNSSADSSSDELATFSYDTPQDIYYVVEGDNTTGIDIISYIDGNEVAIGGVGTTTLDAGQIATFTGYSQGDPVSVLGPINSKTNDNEGEPVVPISFAADTFVTPSNRNNPEEWHVFAPFVAADVDVFTDNGGATAVAAASLTAGGVAVLSDDVAGGDSAVVESDQPILLYAEGGNNDSFNPYPVTTQDLYGFRSNAAFISTAASTATYDVFCASGTDSSGDTVDRGVQGVNGGCTAVGDSDVGSAMRITNQDNPVGAIQQADSDGVESTSFWPDVEFATEYYIPVGADYVAALCSPEYGSVNLEIYSPGAITPTETAVCAPTATSPDSVRFSQGGNGDTLAYNAGTRIVSTNGVPFYAIYDHTTDNDEVNVLGSVQGRKYGANESDFIAGEQEEANGPQYEQLSYGWYQNVDAITPVEGWDLGGSEFTVEGQSITGAGAVDNGDQLRLRMNTAVTNASSSAGTEAFTLQYAAASADQCSLVSDWFEVGPIGSTTAAFTGYNNASVSDGDVLATTTLAQTTAAGTYEERNFSDFNPVEIGPGTIIEWDWVLSAENVLVNQTYCFRMVRAIGEEFARYTTYPELETVGPPNTPTLISFFDNEHTVEVTPSLVFTTTDISGDDVHYEIQIDDDATFGSVDMTADSAVSFLQFTNLNNTSDKAPFTSGAQVRFDAPSDLAASTTYWWRVRATDPDGSATSSDWSAPFNYTVDTTLTTSEWYQTTTEQFATNELSVVTASGGSVVNPGGNGSVTGNPADFDDAVVGNAWGEAFWTSTAASGDILVQVQYNNNGNWQPIPNSEIPGNNLGTSVSPINLLQLDTNVYNELRLVANFTGTGLSLDEWGIRWALRIETPDLGDLFDNQQTADTLPVFDFVSSDPQGDDVEYEISFSTDRTFESSSSTFNSSVDPGFANAASGGDTSPFNSAETIEYTTQVGAPFADGTTYWWRARAKDVFPGGDVFSPWSEADAFTIDSATTLSTWFQTTDEQFDQGFLDGTQVASDSVEISTEVGEYGTADLIGNTWVQIPTDRTYRNMVVIASSEFDFSSSPADGRTTRVRNKTSNSFELKVDNHLNSLSGSTTVDYIVMEAGEWLIDDGGAGVLLLAGTLEDVTEKQISAYDNTTGVTIPFPTNFGTPPAVFVNISSNNDSDWVDAHVDGGGTRATEVGPASMRVALAVGNHTASVHSGPEDIDYLAVGTGTGTIDGDAFQSLNTPDQPDGFGGATYGQPLTGFTNVPAVTLVQNNGEDGGQGGFAFKDLQGVNTNTSLAISVAEIGVNADGHTTEVVSVLAFESDDGIISRINDGTLTGEIAGEDIIFSDGAGPKFANFSWLDTTPGTSFVTYQMQYLVAENEYALIPDAALPGNSAGFTTSPIDLTSVDINIYDQIRPFATLQCVTGDCPEIDSWKLEWSEGVNMSGTLKEYDRSTAVSAGSISAAVNGTLLGSIGTVSGGVWTMNNVTAFAGDVVTVWVDGAAEEDEAVTSFIYDGLGDITDVKLYEQHLSFEADERGGVLTNELLSLYDNSDDEDIFFSVDGLNNLNVCASGGTCDDANIYVGTGQTFIPSTSTTATVSMHDFINDGTIELDANTFNVSGSWDNNATSSTDTSVINMTAAAGTESISSVEAPLDFHTVNFGGFGVATFTIDVPLDLSGDLTVATGTLARDGFDIEVAGNVATEFGGVWQGVGTTTFNGSGPKTWSDTNLVSQNIGNVIIDGASTIVTAQTNVAAYDVFIGGNDSLVGGSAGNTIFVAGDWTNTGTFNAGDSVVEIIPDTRTYPPIVPGSLDWYADTNFDSRVPVVINASQVEGDLTNFPTYLDLSSFGASFWSGVQSDGRDIRITTADGMTELPYDLVEFNAAAQSGELHFLADSISGSLDTTFYVYFDNAAATAYAESDPYGSQAVWSEYLAVYHFTDDPTTIGNTTYDATSNNHDLITVNGVLATTTGQLGVGYDLEGLNGALSDSDFLWTAGDALVTSGWYFMDNADNSSYYEWGTSGDPDQIEFRPWTGGTSGITDFGDTETFTINPRDPANWHQFFYVGTTVTGNNNLFYQDAIQRDVSAQTVTDPENTADGLQIGRQNTTNYFDALIDEFRVTTIARNTDWIEAEYNNQFSPNLFYTIGATDSYLQPTVIDEATHNITAGGSAFYGLTFNDATTSPIFTETSVVVGDDFVIATGTAALPTGVFTVGGSFVNNGFFMHNNGEVEFISDETELITMMGSGFLNGFYNVTFDGSGTWNFTDASATTSNNLTITDGTPVFPTDTLTIGGLLQTSGSGAFDANSGTVKFISPEGGDLTTNGSSFYDVVFDQQGSTVGWYNVLWLDRTQITIPAGTVSEDLTDFPVYVDLSTLGTEFWNSVQNDGGDIRITAGDGAVELPYELVSIDTQAQTGELHFRADTILALADTDFFIYHNNGAAMAYAPADTYGSQAVWSNGYTAVYHFEGEGQPGRDNAGEYTDSTANGYDGEDDTLATGNAGYLGQGVEFDQANAVVGIDSVDHINLPTDILQGTTEGSLNVWYQTTNNAIDHALVGGYGGENEYIAWIDNDTEIEYFLDATNENGNQVAIANIADGDWRHYSFTRSGNALDDEANYYLNGSFVYADTNIDGVPLDFTGGALAIGLEMDTSADETNATNQLLDGFVDEVRFSSETRGAAWVEAEYLTQADPAAFYTVTSQAITDIVDGFAFNEGFTDADNDVIIESGLLVAPSDTFTIGGSAFNNGGSYDPNSATTTFDSTDTGEVVAFGSGAFYNLTFVGVGGGWTVATNTVNNNLDLVTGASYLQSPNTTMTVEGVFTNGFNAAATTWTDSTLALTGGDYTVTDRLESGDDYANVEVASDTDIIIWNSTIANSTINDTSSIYMPDYGGTDGLLRIYGDFDRTTGDEYWSYTTDFDGTDISGTPRVATVEIADGSLVTVASTSALRVDGTGATTTVSAISGSYSLVTDGATVDMQAFSITDTDVNGFQLTNGSMIDLFTAGEFLIASGTGLTVDAATIEAQPSTSYSNLRFQALSGTPSNIALSGIPAGYWQITQASGNRAGESFDNDDGDPGAIQWDDSNFNITISGTVYDDDGVTPTTAPVCNGSTNVVTVVVDGVTSYSAPCNPVDGSYSVPGVSYVGNPKIITYLESSASNGPVVPGIMDSTSGGFVTSNPMTLTAPAMVDDVVLVAIIGKDDDDVINPPAGWVEVDQLDNATGDQISSGIWYKVVSDASAEPATYDFTSVGGEEYSYWMGSLINVDPVTPIDVSSDWSKLNNDVTPTSPSVVTTAANSLVFSPFYVDNDPAVGIDESTGWTIEANNVLSTNNGNLSVLSRVQTVAGATPTADAFAITANRDPQVGQFAFRAAATVSATSSMTAAAVTQTPIGATGDSFNDITLRDEVTDAATVAAGAAIAVSVPTVVTGDVMVLILGREDDFGVTAPAGWTEIDQLIDANGNDTYTGAWYRVVDDAGAEPVSYDFISNDTGTEEYSYWIGSYSNVDTSNPIDVPTTWTKQVDNNAPAAPSITTVTNDVELLAAWFVVVEADVDMPTNPWQVRIEDLQSGTSQRNLSVASREAPTAGPTGDVTITSLGTGDETATIQIALRPSAISVASEITDMDLYQDRVIVRHEDVTPLTIADMTLFDNVIDNDIPFTAETGPNSLTILPGVGLYVFDNRQFIPGGEVELQGAGATAADGSFRIGDSATYTSTDSDPITVGGSFYVNAGGTFAGASSTVTFTATNLGNQIGADASSTIAFYDTEFAGVGGQWAVQTPIEVTENLLVSDGTIVGVSDIEVINGDFSGDGAVVMTGGTTQINTDNTLGGVTPWTFYDLVLGDGVTAGVTTPPATATTTVLNQLTIANGHFLDSLTSTWDLAGNGTVFVENNGFLEGDSTVRYSGTTPTITRTAYNNLVIDTDRGGSVTAVAPTTGLQVLGNLTVGALGTSTFDITTNDPLVAVGGDVYIGTLGTVDASDSGPLDVFGSWNNDGVFAANGGLVEFLQATGTATVAAGASPFADLTFGGAASYTMTESATATSNMQLLDGRFTLTSGETLAVGGVFTNNLEDIETTWTGTTLHLYGSDAYVINPKTVGDSYATIEVSSSTHPRLWNSSVANIVTESGSSLYSMDHDGVDGDLYIFGDFVNQTFADHWSYAEDFDGASLAVPRTANVQIEDGGSVTYLGGSLNVTGDETASTTIAAQGVGPYVLTLGGTTTVDMNYYSVRDVTSDGLILTGSPNIVDLSYGDFEVVDAGGSAITVGGTVINANQAQNFTNNRFATTSAISAVNITATGTAVSSWRFVNVAGNLDGEDLDSDPGGDPGYIVWEDSAAIIGISGSVYQNDRATVSGVCDGVTNNVHLVVGTAGATTDFTTSCAAGTGDYAFSGIGFGPSDTVIVYIDGEAVQAANVTKDPISLISNLDLYENHVIVRHESTGPMTVAAMSVFDSSDDADIPFTATDAVTDDVTVDSDHTLLVWEDKTFAPAGDVTITGAGSGASYDGSLELLPNAVFDGGVDEEYSIGGDLISGTDATFDPELSTTTFTSAATGRTIDTNDSGFHNLAFTGAGAWTIADTAGDVNNDLIITTGTVTLPAATTTITGSFTNSGGAFIASGGTLLFDATDAGNDVTFGGSDAHEVVFAGVGGAWVFGDTNATATDSFAVSEGAVTLPSGILTVGDDFIVTDTVTNNGGTVLVTGVGGGNVVTLSGNDLENLTIRAPAGDYTLTDNDASLLGSLTLTDGAFTVGTGTVAVGGSFDVSGGTYDNGSGTLLFNSADAGEFIDPGENDLYNVVVAGAGAWTLVDNATTTNNFSLTNAGSFTVTPGSTLYVGNVFTNNVGGPATTWTGTTLVLDSGTEYETNNKTTPVELYDTLIIGENTDISSWNSSANTVTVPANSSWYSQDNAAVDGDLFIYGDYHIATTTEYWSAETDFDGTAIAARSVTVQIADTSTVTLENAGTLEIVGVPGSAVTSIANQGAGSYTVLATGGTLNAAGYSLTNIDVDGLQLLDTVDVTSLSNGLFTQTENNQNLITLESTVLNANAGLLVTDTGFADGGFTGGVNVSLDATTTNSWNFTGALGNLWGEAFDVDGTDSCSSIRWDDSDCLLTEQANYQWRNDDGGEGAAPGTWYDEDWSKRQRVRVINEDATAYTDTAVSFTLAYDADMQADFDDVRVTDADGVTLVDYWIERVQAGNEATVWLQAPTLPAETVSEFYVYYGNVSVTTTGDPDAVFNFAEDFEANDLSPYSGDTGLFNIGNTYAFGGALGLDNFGEENERATDGIARDDITVSQGERLRYMQYIDTSAGANDEVCTLFGTQSPVTDNENYAICVEQPGTDRISIVRDVADTEFSGTILATENVTLSSGWYEFNIDWNTDDTISVQMFDAAGAQVASTSATDATYTSGGIGFTYWFQHGGWDSFLAWPRTDTIPTVYVGDEQVDGGASWADDQNTPTGGFLFGETARLRVGIENTGLPIEDQNFRLEYAPKLAAPTCEAVPVGTFVEVEPSASAGSSAVIMQTSTFINNGDATTDHLLTAAGDFVAGEIITDPSNETANYDLEQDRYTELEYAIALTVNAINDSYCFRVTDGGDALDSYANLPELTLAFDPTINPVSLNDGFDIALNLGTTTSIIASTTVTDLNGVADLVAATSTFYTTSAGAACTPDDNNCYIATSTCSFISCTATSCTLECVAPFAYHTNPTDFDGAEEWYAFVEVADTTGASAFATSPGVELLTIRGLDVQNDIAYGVVDVSQDTGTFNPEISLVNVGNESIDVQISGTDMTDGIASVIPAAQQLFATSTFDYAGCIACSALTVTPLTVEVDLDKPTVSFPATTDEIYWGVEVPFGTASNPHTGVNSFTAIGD